MDPKDQLPSASGDRSARPLGAPTLLPSGRKIVLQVRNDCEILELYAPSGEVELSLEIGPHGPTLRLRGARLALESEGSLSLACRDLSIRTTEGIRMEAGGEMTLRSEGDIRAKSAKQIFIDGDYVNLNCLERTGYHDEGIATVEGTVALPADPPQTVLGAGPTSE